MKDINQSSCVIVDTHVLDFSLGSFKKTMVVLESMSPFSGTLMSIFWTHMLHCLQPMDSSDSPLGRSRFPNSFSSRGFSNRSRKRALECEPRQSILHFESQHLNPLDYWDRPSFNKYESDPFASHYVHTFRQIHLVAKIELKQ